ncbi:hypothetical protein EVB61_041 [Rhizobium phage RHph_TM21B]|nr:hypothetical protein EVB61_041 [Rhizobium phage RHph_TM21B]
MAYGEYRGQTLGRIMHFLYKMDFNSDSWARIGFDKEKGKIVIYNTYFSHPDNLRFESKDSHPDGRIFGYITWENDGDSDYPILELDQFFKDDIHNSWQERWDEAVRRIKQTDEYLERPMYSKKEDDYRKRIKDMTDKAHLSASIFEYPFSKVTQQIRVSS